MTVSPLPSDPRLTALLADAATEGLDKAASSELDRLLDQYRSVDADELARPAAQEPALTPIEELGKAIEDEEDKG